MSSTDLGGYATLVDVVNEYTSMDATGTYLWAAQVLNRKCPLIQKLPMVASNQIMSNIGSRDTSLGTAATRRFNEPIAPTMTHSSPFTEPIALFEDYGEVDKALWAIQNNPNSWRQSQDRRKVEGITQGVEYAMFYGSVASDPGSINGFATRFNASTSRPNSDTSWPYNVALGGGSGSDVASIWLIEFGMGKVFGIYPKNLPGGLKITDLGESTKEVTAGMYQVLRTHFEWYIGLSIEDERCVQRYANIESSGSSNTFDPLTLIQLKNQLPSMGEDPGTYLFCPRAIKTQMDQLAVDKSNGYFTQDASGDIFGRPVTRFQGIPVLTAEKLLITETAIS